MDSRSAITQMLSRVREGDRRAADELLPLVYDELRRLAARYLSAETPGHTLSATSLVHEAYLRLFDETQSRWEDRIHFFAVAAQAMRRILVDHARGRQALKRGGGRQRIPYEDVNKAAPEPDAYLLALDDALRKLVDLDAQQCRIIELHYFAGLTLEQTANLLGVSVRTVQRDLTMARGWLHREITRGA